MGGEEEVGGGLGGGVDVGGEVQVGEVDDL